MKIIRTLLGTFSEEETAYLRQFGIDIPANTLKRFYIEDGENYNKIFSRLEKSTSNCWEYERFKQGKNKIFKFSRKDIADSKYCKLRVVLGGGYPQPDGTGEFMEITYNKDYCEKCFLPRAQINNFRVNKISNRPIWGFTAWIFDVIFVHEDFYKQVFEPLGIKCRPVEKVSGKIREGIVQLVLPITNIPMEYPYHTFEICPICGSKRYIHWWNYPCYPEPQHSSSDLFLSKEVFGRGWGNTHDIFISSELAIKLLDLKAIRLDDLVPCRKDFAEYIEKHPDYNMNH